MDSVFSRLKLLIVDDSEDDVFMVRSVLSALDSQHTLEAASSAVDALERLRGTGKYAGKRPQLPDLLLLDVNMPGMDGFAMLKELKSDAELRKIPVIMLSTSNSPQDINRCYDCGAASYLTKPDSAEGFRNILGGFLSYWRTVSAFPE